MLCLKSAAEFTDLGFVFEEDTRAANPHPALSSSSLSLRAEGRRTERGETLGVRAGWYSYVMKSFPAPEAGLTIRRQCPTPKLNSGG
jgi:hypothetical protein